MQSTSAINATRLVALYPEYCKDIVSRHTGRPMVENTSQDMFAIPASWTVVGRDAALAQWDELYKAELKKTEFREVRKNVVKLRSGSDASEFVQPLEDVLRLIAPQGSRRLFSVNRGAVTDLMLLLWRENCLLWPNYPGVVYGAELFLKLRAPIYAGAVFAKGWNELLARKGKHYETTAFARLMLFRSYTDNALDIQPPVIPLFSSVYDFTGFSHVGKMVIRWQREISPRIQHYQPQDFARSHKTKVHTRNDPEFQWATAKSQDAEAWRALAVGYLKTIERSRDTVARALNYWLDFAVDKKIPCNPLDLFQVNSKAPLPTIPFATPREQAQKATLVKFLDFALSNLCGIDDDYGRQYVPPQYRNPLAGYRRSGSEKNAGQTHREPMPTRFVHMCIEILAGDDFAWSKAFAKRTNTDQINWINPESGRPEVVWCPVRAYALLSKLILPARTLQVRMLDSGEADTERYDPATASWRANPGPLAKSGGVQNGVFRSYRRKDGSRGSLIYFNTNKTADTDAPQSRRGYVMPWEQTQALSVFGKLRDWQERYNPIKQLTEWRRVPEFRLRSEAALAAMGGACFLFRDPTDKQFKDLPITDGRLRKMWLALLAELERRLAVAGETLPDGSAIRFVRENKGRITASQYDLHTLRVTLITALYEQGVPPEYIMKVAGHASVLMTLYYVKLSPQDISSALDEAILKKQQDAQTEWLAFLQKKSRDELVKVTAHTHSSGVDALGMSSLSGLLVMDHGFCPMGARRCEDGLVVASPHGKTQFAPVPGGAGNCVRCRFFITGPAFLMGLEAHLNDLFYRVQTKSKRYQEAKKSFEALRREQSKAIENNSSFPRLRELQVAESAYELATAETDEATHSLHAAYKLVQQSLTLATERHTNEKGFSLIVQGELPTDASLALEETHQFEQLQRICESATLFKGLSIDSRAPNLERMRYLDKMLAKANLPSTFSMIDNEEVALQVANEMGRFLYARLKRSQVADLADGKTTLHALSLDTELPAKLEQTTIQFLRNASNIAPTLNQPKELL